MTSTSIILWTWILATLAGSIVLAWMTREAYRDLVRARDEDNLRYVLNARIIARSIRAWLIAFLLFLAVGVSGLIRPARVRSPSEMVAVVLLVAAVAQVAWAMALNWRDSRRLYRMIEREVRERLPKR